MSDYIIDVDVQHAIAGEIGIGFFKRLSRGIKSVGRTVAKAAIAAPDAIKGVRKVLSSPYLQAGLTGLAMVLPVTAPLAAGVIAADKLLASAESGSQVVRDAAKAMIGNTKKLAAEGDQAAQRAMKTIKVVYKRRKEVRAMTPAQRAQYNQAAADAERRKSALLAAARKHERAVRLRGHMITSKGQIVRGTFTQE